MPRRRVIGQRECCQIRRSDQAAGQIVNILMVDGKKSTAEAIVYSALETLASVLVKMDGSLRGRPHNVRPTASVSPRWWFDYQVPVESVRFVVMPAMRWIVEAARNAVTIDGLRPANELSDAAETKGTAVKKREDVHRMADASKAFAHYRR
ncbi:30S ribosomal protein S7 [Shigella flexneri]